MARRKTTVYLDEGVLRATRVLAARTDVKDSDVVEEALRRYLGIGLLGAVWERNAEVDPSDAESVATRELAAMRRARR